MKVLSLFDGMSCGQIALKECGIKVDTYYASEVDKFAITQTQLNFPDTKQLGDVRNIDARTLGHIDLLMGGSPCQSFSFAGKRAGMITKQNEEIYTLERYLELKQAGFEFEGQSYLFWEYVRILHEIRETNPDVLFLLENVEMGKKWENVLSEAIGLRGVHINSALVSAQNRRRIYWTNIKTRKEGLFGDVFTDIPQPADRGFLLQDILEKDMPDKYLITPAIRKRIIRLYDEGSVYAPLINPKKAGCVTIGNNSSKMSLSASTTLITPSIYQQSHGFNKGELFVQKAPALTSCSWEHNNTLCISSNQLHATVSVGKSTPMVAAMGIGGGNVPVVLQVSSSNSSKESPDLCSSHEDFFKNILLEQLRRLTPKECARLQTIPEWYKWECSETQQYKMLGNGWTIEVIKHIFSFLPKKYFK